jgi:hypothetical protein
VSLNTDAALPDTLFIFAAELTSTPRRSNAVLRLAEESSRACAPTASCFAMDEYIFDRPINAQVEIIFTD